MSILTKTLIKPLMLQCTKIISSNPVGDAVHGCPYKHWDESHLRSALQNMRCMSTFLLCTKNMFCIFRLDKSHLRSVLQNMRCKSTFLVCTSKKTIFRLDENHLRSVLQNISCKPSKAQCKIVKAFLEEIIIRQRALQKHSMFR